MPTRFGRLGLPWRPVLELVGGFGRSGTPLLGASGALRGASGGPWRAILWVDRSGPGPGLPPGGAPGLHSGLCGVARKALPPSVCAIAGSRGADLGPLGPYPAPWAFATSGSGVGCTCSGWQLICWTSRNCDVGTLEHTLGRSGKMSRSLNFRDWLSSRFSLCSMGDVTASPPCAHARFCFRE